MEAKRYQDLSRFGGTARGRAAWRAQLWWLFETLVCAADATVHVWLATLGADLIWREDRKARSHPTGCKGNLPVESDDR